MAERVGFFAGQGYSEMQEVALEEAFQHWMSLDNAADHAGYADEDKNTRAEMAWEQFSALRRSFDDAHEQIVLEAQDWYQEQEMLDDIRSNAPEGW